MIRSRIINISLFSISLIFFAYVFYIQCLKHRYYDKRAKLQHEQKFVLLGARGNIYDRNGLPLATSQPCFSIFCTPQYIEKRDKVIREIALISETPESKIRHLVDQGSFFWVERKVDLPTRDSYLEIADPGIGYSHDLNRQYNLPEMFKSLVGVCGSDNCGIEGLEYQLNDMLSGKSGFVIYQKDPSGDIFPNHNYPEVTPEPGVDVYLTIDLNLQSILYSNLKECLVKEDAKHAAGLIVDPSTGEILALVNIEANGGSRNHVVCDEFEPGSTFKLMTLTHALLSGFKESDQIDTEGGKIKVRGHVIHDYKNYGRVTFRQAIAHSSNVAMVKIARKLDVQGFFLLLRDFGFGQATGIELPGEVKGRLPNPDKINELEFATMTFGQGLTVNLLQLTFAYQAIANQGVLNKPLILSEIRDGDKVVYRSSALRIRRIVDETIAQRVTNVLCGVVEEGSGIGANLDNVKIAAKTGTAQKVIDGKYSDSSVITTFIGYFPADAPKYLVAILLDEPKHGMWAGTITAPVFRNVANTLCQISSSKYALK